MVRFWLLSREKLMAGRRMLRDFKFVEAVQNFSEDVCNGRLTEKQAGLLLEIIFF